MSIEDSERNINFQEHGMEDIDWSNQTALNVNISFAEAYDIVLDGLLNEATLRPIDADSFEEVAFSLVSLLIDGNEIINNSPEYDDFSLLEQS
jgi:hypothetical protein